MSEYISGRNPVKELLRAGQKTVNKILLSNQARGSVIEEIVKLAKERKIPIHNVPPIKLDKLSKENNQGVVAEITSASYLDIDELLKKVQSDAKPFIVILDNIEDPHNLGAIIRSAVTFGANGIVIGKWRSAGLTDTVSRTSAGASEHIPIARVTNIAECVSQLKEKGFWVAGAEGNNKPIEEERFSFPLALVIGGEGKGISRLVKERCDILVSIAQTSKISSLNASCAAAVILYEIYKQKAR
ncbi:MAG: 23S rRNA (guanosine(2251)-2'-O)-methyltransferase RlmB [Elusimicrobia bacterium]|nr:23S rRNA (guanosine(2251)-2'-O)-methyltransferase RlmB [Elusimicrobiota bacterium]